MCAWMVHGWLACACYSCVAGSCRVSVVYESPEFIHCVSSAYSVPCQGAESTDPLALEKDGKSFRGLYMIFTNANFMLCLAMFNRVAATLNDITKFVVKALRMTSKHSHTFQCREYVRARCTSIE